MKLLWNVNNNLLKKSNNKSEIVEICQNGKTYTAKTDICNIFNEHFATVGKKVHNSINKSNCNADTGLANYARSGKSANCELIN